MVPEDAVRGSHSAHPDWEVSHLRCWACCPGCICKVTFINDTVYESTERDLLIFKFNYNTQQRQNVVAFLFLWTVMCEPNRASWRSRFHQPLRAQTCPFRVCGHVLALLQRGCSLQGFILFLPENWDSAPTASAGGSQVCAW